MNSASNLRCNNKHRQDHNHQGYGPHIKQEPRCYRDNAVSLSHTSYTQGRQLRKLIYTLETLIRAARREQQ